MSRSRALVFSTHLPVSVCGTDILVTHFRGFLGSVVETLPPVFTGMVTPASAGANPHIQTADRSTLLRHPKIDNATNMVPEY